MQALSGRLLARGSFLGDRVSICVAPLIGRDQLGQKTDRHQLPAQQQRPSE